MSFLSHPASAEKNTDAILLIKHLTDVATRAKNIVSESKFENKDLVCYAGLFHDLGKLGPYYQELFSDPDNIKRNNHTLQTSYNRLHSVYSMWIAEKILEKDFDYNNMQKILMMIYCHHGSMTNSYGRYVGENREKNHATTTKLITNWKKFLPELRADSSFTEFKMDFKLEHNENIKNEDVLQPKNPDAALEEFVEIQFLFSALLQADKKGFFSDSETKNYDFAPLNISTNKSEESGLNDYRTNFQKRVLEQIKPDDSITIINAPTGVGKTNAFLEAIEKYKPLSRVMYFSPLLALTNDFESKLQQMMDDTKEILTYNHVYSGLLSKKAEETSDAVKSPEQDNTVWNFNHESFNEKFVVTTMHRLLMCIYSNKNMDKLKLASFSNALLIIDEVQTLPKFLLKNLCEIFKIMTKKMGTKVIMASATIPHELSEFTSIQMAANDKAKYLEERTRPIKKTEFDVSLVKQDRTLVMLNTRKRAYEKFQEISKQNDCTYYITSGIRKKAQNEIIKKIKSSENKFVLISTQVVEAGVDISFSSIWRQMAPLDNIIQILGRLDRENKDKTNELCIFEEGNNLPYNMFEYKVSKKYLKDIKNSATLYSILPKYYAEISQDNQTQKNESDTLDSHISKLDFESVWKDVSECIGGSYYDSVYIPELENWDAVHADLLSGSKNRTKKHAGLQALLPKSAYHFKEYFDDELFEKKILLPKKEKLKEFYDETVGLDKWI